jgi:tripartite-type tricarboxylate transporter receptor subunit TctC
MRRLSATLRRRALPGRALAGLALAALATPATAQDSFPNRSLRVLVPFPPAGAADILTRLLTEPLSREFGQPVVAENRTGGGGRIGTEAAVRAPADGYTLLMGSQATNSINPELYADLPYDPARDLAPVAMVGGVGSILYVRNGLAARSLPELLALARRRPGELTYGSAGNGGASHLSMALLEMMAGVRMTHVPYRGTAPATTDLLAGQIDAMCDPVTTAMPHVLGGRVRALAVTTPQRLPALPDVPTVAEAGVPGYEAVSYYAFFAPAGVPAPMLALLQARVAKVIAEPAVAARLAEQGMVAMPLSPPQVADYVAQDRQRWREVIRTAGITAN